MESGEGNPSIPTWYSVRGTMQVQQIQQHHSRLVRGHSKSSSQDATSENNVGEGSVLDDRGGVGKLDKGGMQAAKCRSSSSSDMEETELDLEL